MKATEPKSSTPSHSLQTKSGEQQSPFFDKEGANGVLSNSQQPFFSLDGGSNKPFFNKLGIQTKLTIGQPGDKYEQEADRMADQVVQRLAENDNDSEQPALKIPTAIQRKPIFESEAEPNIQAKPINGHSLKKNLIQPKCAECEQEEQIQEKENPGEEEQLQMKPIFESAAPSPPDDKTIQRKCTACAHEEKTIQNKTILEEEESLQTKAEAAPYPTPSLESKLQSTKGSGSPLAENTRSQMEGSFGTDFSGVRVHTDSSAVQMNKDLGAQAFTHGNDIFFNSGKYDTGSTEGQRLLGHELTHTLQQGNEKRIQRTTTRGAGGCGPANIVDEDNMGAKGAGITAHTQIQSFLSPRTLGELIIPRATKTQKDSLGCQPPDTNFGKADLFALGLNIGIAEIKPYPWARSYAVPEAEHYIRRGVQAMDRFSSSGPCGIYPAGRDDENFARSIGVTVPAEFYKISDILLTDTIIGRFDGDPTRTLKARLVEPGAVGYWCTGTGTDTYTCGVSQQETEQYIDRVLLPAQDLLDLFLTESIEEPLEQLINDFTINGAYSTGLSATQGLFNHQIRMINQLLPPGVTVQQLTSILLQQIGPYARPIIVTMLRRLKSQIMNQLRLTIRNSLREMIREAIIALCVGAPVITFVQLMEELKKRMKLMAEQLIPVMVTAALITLAAEAMGAMLQILGQLLSSVLDSLGWLADIIGDVIIGILRILAILLIAVIIVGVIVMGILTIIAAIDPLPGDEVLVGGLTLALASLIPIIWSFVINGPGGDPSPPTA